MPPKDPATSPETRPTKKALQWQKRLHTVKNTMVSDPSKRVLILGKTVPEASTITHYSKKNSIQKRIGLHRPRPLPISAIKASRPIIYHLKISTFLTKNHAGQNRIPILN